MVPGVKTPRNFSKQKAGKRKNSEKVKASTILMKK
jgi:hypothetical protein